MEQNCIGTRFCRIGNWFLQRIVNAWRSFVEDYIKWLIRAVVVLLAVFIAAVIGIRPEWIDTPQWWPWHPPPRTAEVRLDRIQLPDGSSGYAFVNSAFDEARKHLNGRASLRFDPSRLERLRICRAIRFPPQDTVDELIRLIGRELVSCIELSVREDGDHTHYTWSRREGDTLRIVQRANRGGSIEIDHYFCECEDTVITSFLESTYLP